MATPEESASEGDNNGDGYPEADPEDVNPYQPEDSQNERSSKIESSKEGSESYESEESPEDSPQEHSSISEISENEINTYGLQGRYQTIDDQTGSNTSDYYRRDRVKDREPKSPQRLPEYKKNKIKLILTKNQGTTHHPKN